MGLIKFWAKIVCCQKFNLHKMLKFGFKLFSCIFAVYLNGVPCLRGDSLHREDNFKLHLGSEIPG